MIKTEISTFRALEDQDRNFNISGSGISRQKFQHFGLWKIETEISTSQALKDQVRKFNISGSERSRQKLEHFGLWKIRPVLTHRPRSLTCMRALFKKCVRHSVCQRAVSARRALTGLSANHLRVKQYHVCQSAIFCAVSAGKRFRPWSVFSFASRPIYFTPFQCPAPLPLNVHVYFPESF